MCHIWEDQSWSATEGEEKGKTFSERSKAQMDGLIGPLREQLGELADEYKFHPKRILSN